MQLFLDADGVLADFDTAAESIFGLPPRKAEEKLGQRRFWVDLQRHIGFYRNLPLMPDANKLYKAVKHLKPIILTGCPRGGWSEADKIHWAKVNFPGVKMITCQSRDKREHMTGPGDILVDDYLKYRDLWVEAGGVFLRHTSAESSIAHLKRMRVI
jgi:5'(3')-deoxyribonucleotidase